MKITIQLLDGTEKIFPDETRPGGSYANRLRYEPGFVVVTNVWGNETSIPERLIKEIKTYPRYS